MKVDLRNNMLDKDQADNKKNFSLFGGLFGGGKKQKKLEIESSLMKKLGAPEKINRLPSPEENVEKIREIGIGESEFKSTKELDEATSFLKNPVEKKREEKEEIEESEFVGQSDYQTEMNYPYQESEYLKNFPEKVLVQWQGPDYEFYPKSKRWYTIAGLILASIVAYSVLKDSPLTAIVFILIGIVGYMYLERDPQLTDFAVSYDGIVVGNEVYEWDDIVSFWIFYDPPHTRVISLHMRGKLMPYIHIPLHQVDPVEVREKMMEFVPEVKQEQGMVDILERLLHM